MKFKKIILIILAIAIILGIIGVIVLGDRNKDNNIETNYKYKVAVSNFACYDFLRAIIGETNNIELVFLIGPGKDAHSYDPTAGDIIEIQNADLFVYVGGELEKWSDKIIDSLDKDKTNVVRISDFVDTIEEKMVDGAEETEDDEKESLDEEHVHNSSAFDEHIWTSPENAVKMVYALEKELEKIDSENIDIYEENAEKYIIEIKKLDFQIRNIVDNKVRDRLVFADKMPMQYFMDYYNLKVSAAFDGCSTETEPSAKTIAYLQNLVKEEKIPVVLYIELNPGTVAKTIAEETGSTAMQIQTLHNVSLDDFNNGETWVSLMTRNLDVLKKALD